MIWVILATFAGAMLGAALSRPLLKGTAAHGRWTTMQPSDAVGGLASFGLVGLTLLILLLSFGAKTAGWAAIAGAICAIGWSAARRAGGRPAWLLAAQGAAAGVTAVPVLLGVGLAAASLGGPMSGSPEVWRDLVGDRAFPAWVATVRGGTPENRLAAMNMIRNTGEKALPIVLEGLTNDAPRVRAAAVDGLGVLKPKGAYERARPLLDDPDKEVRKSAAGALSALNDPRAIVALFEAAGKSKEVNEPQVLATQARKLPGASEKARGCLLGEGECAGSENARFGAIKTLSALTGMGTADSKPILVALRDPSTRIRKSGLEACRYLVRQWANRNGQFFVSLTAMNGIVDFEKSFPAIDPNELIAAAAPLIEDEDKQLRVEAGIFVPSLCESSGGFNNIEGPPIGDPDSRLPRLSSQRLGPIFLRMLKSPDRGVAGSAARALAYLGDRRAIPVLKEVDAAENSTYNCLYCAALEALGVGPLAHSTTYPGALK